MGPEKPLMPIMKWGELYFSPTFKKDFELKGHPLRLGSLGPKNASQISRSLKDMSAESIRNRFLGSKKEFSKEELTYLTEFDGINHYAIGVEEQFNTQKGIAAIRMVRSSDDPQSAEVAITIIDEYQKIGLGSILMKLIVVAASERNIETLSFTFLPQNDGIQKLIQKVGQPRMGEVTRDFEQLFLDLKDLDLKKIKEQLAQFLQ